MMLFVIGKWNDNSDHSWSIQGVFDTKDAAVEAAESGWFVAPILLNQKLPAEDIEWPDLEVKS